MSFGWGASSSTTSTMTNSNGHGNTNSNKQQPATDFMSIKQAIAGPSPPQSYAGLVKAVMRYRQKRVYILAFSGVALLLTPATIPVAGFDAAFAFLYPTVWLFLALAATATLPVFVSRKKYMTITPPQFSDRFAQYRNLLFSRQARLTLAAYALSAAIFSFAYACLVTYLSPSRSYLWLVRSPGRDLLQINEKFVYISLTLFITTSTYAIQQILKNRHVLHFDLSSPPIPARLQARLLSNAANAPALAASTNITTLGLYVLFRRPFLRVLIYRIPGGRILRPYLMAMLRHNGLSASLLLATLAVSTAALLALELANTFADVYYSQPISVASFSSEPTRTLLDGLQSDDAYTRLFAFIELRELAITNSKARVEIFTDIKGRSFDSVSKVCLTQLGLSYRNLQRRGQSARAPTNAGPSAGSGATAAPGSRPADQASVRMPVVRENAFKPTQRTFLDAVTAAVPGPATSPSSAVSTVTAAVPTLPPKAAAAVSAATSSLAKIPAIFQQKAEEKAPEELKKAAANATAVAKKVEQTLLEKIKAFAPENLRQTPYWRHLFDPLLRTSFYRSVPNTEQDCAAATALTAFMVASLHEDQYGVAQGDIPKVLEAYIQYLGALESYAAGLNSLADEGKVSTAEVRTLVSTSLQPTIDVVREGIVSILQTFSAYLDDIKFPPSIARRLQDYL